MWGSFLDKGKELAAQAKKAAVELDKHLNESVGVQQISEGTNSNDDIDDALNDVWGEDDDDNVEIAVTEDEDKNPGAFRETISVVAVDDQDVKEKDSQEEADTAPTCGDGDGCDNGVETEDGEFDEVEISDYAAVQPADGPATEQIDEAVMETPDAATMEPAFHDELDNQVDNAAATETLKGGQVKDATFVEAAVSATDGVAELIESVAETVNSSPSFLVEEMKEILQAQEATAIQNAPAGDNAAAETTKLRAPDVATVVHETFSEQDQKDESANFPLTSDSTLEQDQTDERANAPLTLDSAIPAFGGSLFGSLAQLAKQPLFPTKKDNDAVVAIEGEESLGEIYVHKRTTFEQSEKYMNSMEASMELPRGPEERVEVLEFSNTSESESDPQREQQQESEPRVEYTPLLPSVVTPVELSLLSQSDEVARLLEQQNEYTRIMEAKLEDTYQRLSQREEQLLSKTEQLTMMEAMHESEKHDLMLKIQATKDEAKRRIQIAKERVESMELRYKNAAASQNSNAEDAGKQAEIITALREEGEKLARKQADMEAAVRSAKGETRELREQLEETELAKNKSLSIVASLEAELKTAKDDLASARQGESQAGKLDLELRNTREESEKRASTILLLEQEVKELKAAQKELSQELNETRKGVAVETEHERKKLLSEHNHVVIDLETKLRSSEREAAVREDALRHEVDELRKRWQDAVRRADSLSVDVQSSTAPLLRQLESANKQNRARAAAWAEMEAQLRAELEENVILNEKLSKERGEWKTKCSRLERSTDNYETELKQLKGDLHDKSEKVQNMEHKLEEIEVEGAKMKAQWAEVERLANEGVSRVRSEMMRTVVDAEERHRAQLDSLEARLRQEREQRAQLEEQVQGLLDNAGMFVPTESGSQIVLTAVKEAAPKQLRQSQGQAEILVGALGGLGDDDEQSESYDEDEQDLPSTGTSSFAALEQLSSRLKASKVELTTLRTRLMESEKTREELVQMLAESGSAREKLPLFEARVQELTAENKELAMELQGLREDIADVRELYRTQLNVLLEAQAAIPRLNGGSKQDLREIEESVLDDKCQPESLEAKPEHGEFQSDANDDKIAPEVDNSIT